MKDRIRVSVRDWGDDETTEQVIHVDRIPNSICYDGGRIDIDGHADTIWVSSNSFTIEFGAEL